MKKQLSLLAIALLLTVSFVFAQNRETRDVGGTFTKVAFRLPGKLYLRQGSAQKVEIEGPANILKEIEMKVDGGKLIVGREGKWTNWKWNDDYDKIRVYVTVKDLDGVNVSGSGDVIGETKFTSSSMDLNVSGSGSLSLDADVSGDVDADVSGSGGIDLKGKCNNFASDVSGSGRVDITMAVSENARFGVSGSGKIGASGSASVVKTSISGSGKILASNMAANRCEVRISGSGDVEINVQNELDANISGSGTVSYKGNPSKVNSHASGSGTVRKM